MTFNTDTFLPPVLAVGAGERTNGRNQLGSGLVTHKGIIDANSFRATGILYPQHGKGVELIFNQANSTGILQAYDRDAQQYLPMAISASKLALPPNTAQLTAGTRWIGSWVPPAAGAWYESPSQQTISVTAGNMVRIEASGTLLMTTAGPVTYIGLGLDGAMVYDSMQAFSVATGGPAMGYSVVGYMSTQITTSGNHRFAVFLYINNASGNGFWSGAYQYIYATEQRA